MNDKAFIAIPVAAFVVAGMLTLSLYDWAGGDPQAASPPLSTVETAPTTPPEQANQSDDRVRLRLPGSNTTLVIDQPKASTLPMLRFEHDYTPPPPPGEQAPPPGEEIPSLPHPNAGVRLPPGQWSDLPAADPVDPQQELLSALENLQNPPAPEFESTVQQGRTIRIGDTECTAGFVDVAHQKLYTAGHCAKVGEEVFLGDRAIGVVVASHVDLNSEYWSHQGDIAVIDLYDPQPEGVNAFSDTAFVDPASVRVGQKVCAYGDRSRTPSCGVITQVKDNFVMFSTAMSLIGGDSGGPVFVPGVGILGLISGHIGDMASATMLYNYLDIPQGDAPQEGEQQ